MCLPTQPIPPSLTSPISSSSMAPECSSSPFSRSKETTRRRRVQFASDNDSLHASTPSSLSTSSRRFRAPSPPSPLEQFDDWSEVWYGAADLDGFRNEARQHCRILREYLSTTNTMTDDYSSDSSSSTSSSTGSETCTKNSLQHQQQQPLLAHDEYCRGLEQRCCLERQRRKYLTNRCIVRAQSKLSVDQLAELAQKCTAWASELAAEEGQRDYSRAYSHSTGTTAPSSLQLFTKRPVEVEPIEQPERCVRPRLVV